MSKIDKIEIFPETGIVQVRIRKTVTVGGGEVDAGFHRLTIAPGEDADAKIAANMSHLRDRLKVNEVPPEALAELEDHRAKAQTPEKVKAFRAKVVETALLNAGKSELKKSEAGD